MLFFCRKVKKPEEYSDINLQSTDAENRTEGAVLFLAFFLIFKIF